MDKKISHLHYITQDVIGLTHSELVNQACKSGVDWVQLRMKNATYNEWLDESLKSEIICRNHHAKLIINDNVLVAKAAKADGVHLGKSDMSPTEARQILGENAIIGGSANSFEDVLKLVNAGVDYVGFGPYRFTVTKQNLSPILGLEGYQSVLDQCEKNGIKIPIIAIGGIKTEDVKPLMEKGVYGIAVSSAINLSDNPTNLIKRFKNKIKFEVDKNSLR